MKTRTALALLISLTFRAYWIQNMGPPYITTEPLLLRRNLSRVRVQL